MFSFFKKKTPQEKLKEFFDKYPDVFANAIQFTAAYEDEEVESDWGPEFDWQRHIRCLHDDNHTLRITHEIDSSNDWSKQFLGLGFFRLPIWNADTLSWEDESRGKFNEKGKFSDDKFDRGIFLFGDTLKKLAEKAGIIISAKEIFTIDCDYNRQHILLVSGPGLDDLYAMIQKYKTNYIPDSIRNAMNKAQKKTKFFPTVLSNIIVEYAENNIVTKHSFPPS